MKKKILVADMNKLNILLYKMVLRNYIIIEAADGEDAIEKFKSEKPQLVILNTQLTKIDGLDVARTIKKIDGHARIAMITATEINRVKDREKAIEAGCDYFHLLPIRQETLLEIAEDRR